MVFTYHRLPNSEDNYWSTFNLFPPLNELLEYILYNDPTGVQKIQVDWLSLVAMHYPKIEAQLFAFMNQSVQQWSLHPPPVYTPATLFLDSISLPKNFASERNWELDFSSINGFDYLCLEMNDWEPVHLSVSV